MRNVRTDRMSISIYTPIGDDESATLGDMITDDFTIEKKYSIKMKKVTARECCDISVDFQICKKRY